MPSTRPLDYVLAFVGWSLILGGFAFPLGSLLLPPDPFSFLPVFGIVALLAAPLAWWYLRTGHSLGDLGTFYFAAVAIEVMLGLALYALVSVTSLGSAATPEWPGVPVVVTVYALAYLFVYRDGWARVRGRSA